MRTGQTKRTGFTLVELLVVIAIIGILIGMLLPAVQAIRAAARRSQCSNNVRQLAFAVHNFQSALQHFPPGVVDDDDDHRDALHSGFIFLAPYLELGNISDQYDRNLPWSDPSNLALAQFRVSILSCPENETFVGQDGGFAGQGSDYALNKGDLAYLSGAPATTGVFDLNSRVTMSDITDGGSNTFLLGEAASNPSIPAASS